MPRILLLASGLPLFLCSCARKSDTAHVTLPTLPTVIERQIQNALDAGDGDYQLRELRDRVIANGDDLDARLALGKLYREHGYPELALDHFRMAASKFPDSTEAVLQESKLLRDLDLTPQAVEVLDTFLSSHPQPAPILASWLGIFRDQAGDWEGGETAHRLALAMALQLGRDHDYLHNNLGFSLLTQHRRTEAAEEFRRALRLNPASAIARDNLGIALQQNPREAILNWQSLGEPASAHSNMAALLIEQGKYQEAHRELDIALGYNAGNLAALTNLKLLAELDGKPATLPVKPARTIRSAKPE